MLRIKQWIFVFLLSAFCRDGFAQIEFTPVFISPCDNKVIENDVLHWNIYDSIRRYGHGIWHDQQSVIVDHPGIYTLSCMNGHEMESIEIKIPDVKHFSDTFTVSRLHLAIYISNPPFSEYMDCFDSLAEGTITDYYMDGSVRYKGSFKDGQPVDTLFHYYRGGGLEEIMIPDTVHKSYVLQSLEYYPSGILKRDYNRRKKYIREYHENGKLKAEDYWHRYKKTMYYESGALRQKENKKRQLRYSESGIVTDKIKRKFVPYNLVAKRMNRFYEYKWIHFDANNEKSRVITYFENYPKLIDYNEELRPDEFLKAIYYRNKKPFRKIQFEYIEEGDQYVKKMVLYRYENNEWVKDLEADENLLFQYMDDVEKMLQTL